MFRATWKKRKTQENSNLRKRKSFTGSIPRKSKKQYTIPKKFEFDEGKQTKTGFFKPFVTGGTIQVPALPDVLRRAYKDKTLTKKIDLLAPRRIKNEERKPKNVNEGMSEHIDSAVHINEEVTNSHNFPSEALTHPYVHKPKIIPKQTSSTLSNLDLFKYRIIPLNQKEKGRQISQATQKTRQIFYKDIDVPLGENLQTTTQNIFKSFFQEFQTLTLFDENNLEKFFKTHKYSLFEFNDTQSHNLDKNLIQFPYHIDFPGLECIREGNLRCRYKYMLMRAHDGVHYSWCPTFMNQIPPILKIGNSHPLYTLFSEIQKTQERNQISNPRYGYDYNSIQSLFTLDQFFHVFNYLDNLPHLIQKKVQKFCTLEWTTLQNYKAVQNIKNALRDSSLRSYFNHLNRITEYFQAQDILRFGTTKFQYTKTWCLINIQNGTIDVDHLSSILLWLQNSLNLAPHTISKIHAGWAFFYKHLCLNYPLDDYLYNQTLHNIKKMPWTKNNASHPINITQLNDLIRVAKQPKYHILGDLIIIGANFITRISEIHNARFNDFGEMLGPDQNKDKKFYCMNVQKSKNSRIPKQKVLPIELDTPWNVQEAIERLRKKAPKGGKATGVICFLPNGKPMSLDQLRKLFNKAVEEWKSKHPQYKKFKVTWHSLRSGMIGILFSIGLSEPEIKQISLHSKNSQVLRSSYIDKMRIFQNDYLRTFLKDIFTFGKLQHSLPRAEIRKHAEKLFAQVDPLQKIKLKDTKERLTLENSLHAKISGIPLKSKVVPKPLPSSPQFQSPESPKIQQNFITPINKPKTSKQTTYSKKKAFATPNVQTNSSPKLINNDIVVTSDEESSSDEDILTLPTKLRTQPSRQCKKLRIPTNPAVNLNIVDDTYYSDMEDCMYTQEELESLISECHIEFHDTGIPFVDDVSTRDKLWRNFVNKWAKKLGSLIKKKLDQLQRVLDDQGSYLNF